MHVISYFDNQKKKEEMREIFRKQTLWTQLKSIQKKYHQGTSDFTTISPSHFYV